MPKSTYSDRARTPRQSHHSYPYTVEESLTMAEWRTDARGETIGQSKTMRKQYNHHDVAQGGLVPLFQGFHQNLLEGGNANGSRYAGSRASSRGGGSIKQIGWHGANEEEEVRSTTGSHVKNWVNGQGKQGTYSVQGGKKGNGSIVGSTRHGGPVPGSKIGGSTRYGGSIRGSKTGGTPRYGGSAAAGGQSVSIAAKHLKERNILFTKFDKYNHSPRCLSAEVHRQHIAIILMMQQATPAFSTRERDTFLKRNEGHFGAQYAVGTDAILDEIERGQYAREVALIVSNNRNLRKSLEGRMINLDQVEDEMSRGNSIRLISKKILAKMGNMAKDHKGHHFGF